jgi:hypothetical protein
VNDDTKQAVAAVVEKTVAAAEETVRKPGVQSLARLGFYTKGFLFIVIGGLAMLLVFGLEGGKITDPAGALTTIADTRYGRIFLIVFIAGALGHGIWNILRGAADIDNVGKGWQGIVKRSVAVGLGLFYLGLAVAAVEIVVSASRGPESSQAEETFISILIAIPLLGSVFLAIIGLGVIIGGAAECYNGVSGKFQENYKLWKIAGIHLIFINVLGVLSFSARAVLLVILGFFFLRAAIFGGDGAVGLDAALMTLLQSGYGQALVFLAAAGLMGHGILAFYEARYRRIC